MSSENSSECPECGEKIAKDETLCEECEDEREELGVVSSEEEVVEEKDTDEDEGEVECPKCKIMVEIGVVVCPKCKTELEEGEDTSDENTETLESSDDDEFDIVITKKIKVFSYEIEPLFIPGLGMPPPRKTPKKETPKPTSTSTSASKENGESSQQKKEVKTKSKVVIKKH